MKTKNIFSSCLRIPHTLRMPSVRHSVIKSKWKTNGKTEGRAWRVPLQNLTSSSQEQRWRNIKTRTGYIVMYFSTWWASKKVFLWLSNIYIYIYFYYYYFLFGGHVQSQVSWEECEYIFNLLSKDEGLLLRCFMRLKANFSCSVSEIPRGPRKTIKVMSKIRACCVTPWNSGTLMEANDRYSPTIVRFLLGCSTCDSDEAFCSLSWTQRYYVALLLFLSTIKWNFTVVRLTGSSPVHVTQWMCV